MSDGYDPEERVVLTPKIEDSVKPHRTKRVHLPGPDFQSKKRRVFQTSICGIRFRASRGTSPREGQKDVLDASGANCPKCFKKRRQARMDVSEEYPTSNGF